jgi:tetratricopeptide (TPR) repeat protein
MRRSWEAAIGLILFASALPSPQARAAVDGAVGAAAPCSVAGGRDANNNTLNCNFGLTPEQFKQLTDSVVKGAAEAAGKGASEAAVEAAKKTQQEQIDTISKTLGVTDSAVKSLLKIVGEDPNVPDDRLAESLSKAAEDYKRLQVQVAALNPDNPTAKALVEQAKPEIEGGHFARAHELLHQATQAQIAAAQEAHKLKEQAQAAEDAQMLGAATSTAAEGDIAMTERHYKEAAELFGQAVDYVPSRYASDRGSYLLRQGDALLQQGFERGDNDALRNSIEVCGRALAEYPRSGAPLEWARAQLLLGNALLTLGSRESGTEKLEEAAAVFRAALEELTRDRDPLDWAGTQYNLGNTLSTLGSRESGTEKLEEAVAAYRAALEEQTRDRVPLDWARTQGSLGNALSTLGQRESGTARLEEAVAAYRAALEEETRDRVPLDWATAESNLGNALEQLGERESGTARLEEAVQAYRAALEEQTLERVPLDWAEDSGNQGCAMMLIADRTNDGAVAETALQQIQTAYEKLRDGGHQQWAAYYEGQLPRAKAIRDRLNGK